LRSDTYFKLCFEIGLIPNINYSRIEDMAFERQKICEITEELPTSSKTIETKVMSQYEKVS
jgi:hypothetical protein